MTSSLRFLLAKLAFPDAPPTMSEYQNRLKAEVAQDEITEISLAVGACVAVSYIPKGG